MKKKEQYEARLICRGIKNERQLTDSGLMIYQDIEMTVAIESSGLGSRLKTNNEHQEGILMRCTEVEMTL